MQNVQEGGRTDIKGESILITIKKNLISEVDFIKLHVIVLKKIV